MALVWHSIADSVALAKRPAAAIVAHTDSSPPNSSSRASRTPSHYWALARDPVACEAALRTASRQLIDLLWQAGHPVQRTTAAGEFARLQHGNCHLAVGVQQTSIRGDQRRLDGVGERGELAVGWIGHKPERFRMRRTAEPVLGAKQVRDTSP